MSVAMAWDGARAVELLGTQRPEMVVIDLALAGRAGYALVARLAACDPPPVAALVAGDDDAPAASPPRSPSGGPPPGCCRSPTSSSGCSAGSRRARSLRFVLRKLHS